MGNSNFHATVLAVFLGVIATASYGQDMDDLREYVSKTPRGVSGIPSQWFEMNTVIGWEPMVLFVGYADNRSLCAHLITVAKAESPDREFRCVDAN